MPRHSDYAISLRSPRATHAARGARLSSDLGARICAGAAFLLLLAGAMDWTPGFLRRQQHAQCLRARAVADTVAPGLLSNAIRTPALPQYAARVADAARQVSDASLGYVMGGDLGGARSRFAQCLLEVHPDVRHVDMRYAGLGWVSVESSSDSSRIRISVARAHADGSPRPTAGRGAAAPDPSR